MNATDGLEVRLRDWMVASSSVTAPTTAVERALDAIDRVRQRPAILVRTRVGPATWEPGRRTAARVLLVGLLIVALVGAAVMVASRRPDEARPRPSGPLPSAPVPSGPQPSPALSSVPLRLTMSDNYTFGMFEPFGPGLQGRVSVDDPALVRLTDGRALVIGGASSRNGPLEGLDSVGIYDPVRREVTATGSMNVARAGATAVTLADGRVLVLGGYEVKSGATEGSVAVAEIFDPTTGRFTAVDPVLTGRDPCHCGVRFRVLVRMHATLMGDGRVFIAGGSQAGVAGTSFADIFDPGSGSFERMDIGCDAARSTQTALADGRILVLCFVGSTFNNSTIARIFDPGTNRFTVPAQPTGGSVGLATLLSDGRVLVTGPALVDAETPAEVFDPATDSWSRLDATVNPSVDAAVTLTDGRVAFLSGDAANSVLFDPSTNAFVAAPRIPAMVASPPVWLSGNRMLFLSGTRSNLYLYEMEPDQ